MSLFESASLVVTPNGTKASKLYAIKPTSGAGDLSVTRATTATRVNSAGLIESVAVNVPRLDYTNSNCPSILVEPQRTNVLLRSEEFNNGVWSTSSANISANATLSPDGNMSADKLIPINGANPSTADASQLQQVLSVTSNTYTFSIFAKAAGQNSVRIRENNSWGNFLNVNLTNGDFNIIGGNFGQFNNVKVTPYANSWYRIAFTTEAGVTNFNKYSIRGGETGNGTDGIFIWGAQLEAGAYATSYIPTTSASVTRNADVISKTGISSLIGQTEGTFLLDFVLKNPLTATNRIFSLTETDWLNGGSIRLDITSSSFVLDIAENTATSAQITYNTTPQQNTRYKVAIAYKQNDCKMYVNGVDAGSDTSTIAMPTCSELHLNALGGGFNAPYEASNINTASLWKTRLTNAELAQLTTI
jgi:hypothetical protein